MLWFEAEKVGSFDVFCAEYCGLQHADMISKVIVMPEQEFDIWYRAAEPTPEPSNTQTETDQTDPTKNQPQPTQSQTGS